MRSRERSVTPRPSPVHGLPRRRLPFLAVLTQSVAAVAPSGAAAVIPALLITTIGGGGAMLSFGVATVVSLVVAASLRPMAQRMAAVGGIYSYTAKGIGAWFAIPTGWSAMVGYLSVSMAGLLAVGTYLTHSTVAAGVADGTRPGAIVATTSVAAVLATLVMVRGIWVSAVVMLLVEAVSIVLLGVVMIVLLLNIRTSDLSFGAAMSWDGDLRTLALSVVVAMSAFVGFESSSTLSREAKHPFRSVPRAIALTPILAGALYLMAVPIQSLALAGAPTRVREGSTPLVELLSHEGLRTLSFALDLAIATSFLACTLASTNALVRVMFTMGREGVLPKAFGYTHPRFKTPVVGIVLSMVAAAGAPIMALLLGATPDQGMRIFLTVSACGYLGSYLAACACTPALLRRIGESTPAIWALGALATSSVLVIVAGACLFAVRSRSVELGVYGAVIATSVLYTLLLRVLAPDRLAATGIHDETQPIDVLWGGTFR